MGSNALQALMLALFETLIHHQNYRIIDELCKLQINKEEINQLIKGL